MKKGQINITTENNFHFKIIKETIDPLCNRLSIGGTKEEGCYILFRGHISDCEQVLEEALKAFKKAKQIYLTQMN